MNEIYNFSAGPGTLFPFVKEQIMQELESWNGTGHSVMEISHRHEYFLNLVDSIKTKVRALLNIPKNYQVLLTSGGARAQFAALPINFGYSKANYITSGFWSKAASIEAKKHCQINEISFNENLIEHIYKNTDYTHFCSNETIEGFSIFDVPKCKNLIADMSSDLLSRSIDVNNFAVIYAACQKNLGIAGTTLVIIRDDFLEKSKENIAGFLSYKNIANSGSLYNTPDTFSYYVMEKTLSFLEKNIKNIYKENEEKAQILYNIIDQNDFYENQVPKKYRSQMNVIFNLKNKKDELFLQKAHKKGLLYLKGHRAKGGIRASIYNAMPLLGVQKLANFMQEFAKKG